MASERGRVILIFGTVGVIAAAAGYYFFGVYRPHQVAADARHEVEQWEKRWTSARGCLLGTTPASSKTSEALAVHELAPDPWDRGACTGLMARLTRGDAPDTGLRPVENAWTTLDHAATKAAAAFVEHVDRLTAARVDPLPEALDALDAARAALRTAVGLPISEATGGAPLPAAQLLPIRSGDVKLGDIDWKLSAHAHGAIVFSNGRGRTLEIIVPAGGTPQIAEVGDGELRAVPDSSWGLNVSPDGKLAVGALDASGAMATPTLIAFPNATAVSAAIGTLADGTIAFGGNDPAKPGFGTLGIAHLHGAQITVEPPIATAQGFSVTDTDGRALVVWATPAKSAAPSFHARMLGTDTKAIDVPGAATGSSCLSRDRAWIAGEGMLYATDGQSPPKTLLTPDAVLLGCSPDGAVLDLTSDRGQPLRSICTTECRDVPLPHGALGSATVTTVGGKLIAISVYDGVVAVWREGAATAFFGLPQPAMPGLAGVAKVAFTDGKVIDVPVRDAAGNYAIVRVPAT